VNLTPLIGISAGPVIGLLVIFIVKLLSLTPGHGAWGLVRAHDSELEQDRGRTLRLQNDKRPNLAVHGVAVCSDVAAICQDGEGISKRRAAF
jgi:hypothetical protein